MTENHKSGFVSIVGKPNVGKSTLVNALLGMKLSIVSPKAQTTRHRIYGILNAEDYQIILVDTPGVIKPKYKLHSAMMQSVVTALHDAEVVMMMVDANEKHSEEELIFKVNKSKLPVVLVINKMDESQPEHILGRIEQLQSQITNIQETVVISALHKYGLDGLVQTLLKYLPEGPEYYDKEQITDRPERFFVSEIIREKIFLLTDQELPYSCTILVQLFEERENMVYIDAEIHVERQNHKAMLIGKNGSMVKKIGTDARKDIEKMLAQKVYLNLYVRVSEKWKDSDYQLKNFGYGEKS